MSELHEICRAASALHEDDVPFVLATVVSVEGSAYRRPGARMVVAEHRRIAGSISGGCLERDVLVRGHFRTRRGPVLVAYEARSSDSVGSGCEGVVEVLLERVDATTPLDPTRFVAACFAAERPGVLLTVLSSEDGSVPTGARVVLYPGGEVEATVDGETRDALLAAASVTAAPASRPHELAVRGVRALHETIAPPPHLFVVGTQLDTLPLLALARVTGLDATVFEASPEELARLVDQRWRAAVVLMSHSYERDRDCLAAVLGSRARYIGVLGPRSRTARMLAERGLALTAEQSARLHAPVGIDLGAETPEEIALAILAEVEASWTNASARPLRDREGRIHE